MAFIARNEDRQCILDPRDQTDPFTIYWRVPNAEALAEFQDDLLSEAVTPNGKFAQVGGRYPVGKATLRLAFRCVKRWTGYYDEENRPVPLTWENFKGFPNGQMMGLFLTELNSVLRPSEAEEKNSVRPSVVV